MAKIGIIGSGNVGGTLGKRWAAGGHTVVFGSRNPESEEMKKLVAGAGGSSRAATPAEAVAASDILALTTPWAAAEQVVRGAAAGGALDGKILIDALNPLTPDLKGLAVGPDTSAGELVAGWAPGARVVKCFNTVGYNIMADPKFGERSAVMFYCGDDAGAKAAVHPLAAELGFDPVDAGPLRQARALEYFALLWISLAFTTGIGREIGFSLMRR